MIICHLPAIFKLKQNFFIAFLCFACHLIRIIISLFQLFLIYDTYFLPSRGFATIFLIIINHILLLIVFFLEHLLYTNSNRHCICKQCDDEIQGPCCNLGRFIYYSFPILPICWCSSHLTRVSMFTFTWKIYKCEETAAKPPNSFRHFLKIFFLSNVILIQSDIWMSLKLKICSFQRFISAI